MQRRTFLASTGLAVGTTLAGCFESEGQPGADSDSPSDREPPTLPDGLARVLGMVPQRADGFDAVEVSLGTVDPDAEGNNPLPSVSTNLQDGSGVDPEDAERFASVTYGGLDRLLYVLVGTFDAETVEVPDAVATHIEDGLLIGALGFTEPWEAGVDAAVTARENAAGGLATEATAQVLAPIGDPPAAVLYPNPAALSLGSVADRIELIGVGRAVAAPKTEQVTYSVLANSDGSESSLLEGAMGGTGYPPSVIPVERSGNGRLRTATFEQRFTDQQLEESADNSPFFVGIDRSELVYTGTDPLETGGLTLVVDGEVVPAPWETDSVDSQDRFDLEVAPFSVVTVVRRQEGEPIEIVAQELATPQNAFTQNFDEDARTLTIEYSQDRPAPAGRLRLVSELGASQQRDQPLSELVGERLDPGEQITVEGVRYGEQIDIETRVKTHRSLRTSSVFYFSDPPPGYVRFERTGEPVTVSYRGETQPADQIRLQVDDEPTATQFDDQYDQLSGGETVDIEAPAYAVVEALWTGQDVPVTLREYTVPPRAEFNFEYDRDATVIEITHVGGDAVRVDSLEVELDYIYESDYETTGLENVEELTDGDSFRIDIETNAEPLLEEVRLTVRYGATIASEQFSD